MLVKAQIAILETLFSMVLLTAAGSSIVTVAYFASQSQDKLNFNYQNFEYDFENIAYKNASLEGCLANLTQQCGAGFLDKMNAFYGFNYSQLSVDGRSVSVGNKALCARSNLVCLPAESNQTYYQACAYVCGD